MRDDGGISITGITAIAAGSYHSLALTDEQRILAWGRNYDGQLGDRTKSSAINPVQAYAPGIFFTSIAGGSDHTVALDINGIIWAVGNNNYGQLGTGVFGNNVTSPRSVSSLTDTGMIMISGGGYHTVALDDYNQVWAWGDNSYGQLGNGSLVTTSVPQNVELPDLTIVDARAGGDYSVALADDGTVWTWGYNYYGQLGNWGLISSTSPVLVSGLDSISITAVSAGYGHVAALDSNGNAWAWGNNENGQLGNNDTVSTSTPVAVVMPGNITFTAISAGECHTAALDKNGNAWAWGCNYEGEIGNNAALPADDELVPVAVAMPEGVTFTAISAGAYHTLGLAPDGTVWAWGANWDGELGNGTTDDSSVPVLVAIPEGVTITAIMAGGYHNFAIDNTGAVWAWGYNSYGQLGDGTTDDILTPVIVSYDIDLVTLFAGYSNTFALTNSDYIWAWGENDYGQLGFGMSPSQVFDPDKMSYFCLDALPIEIISVPDAPTGVGDCGINISYDYSVEGASSNFGHAIEYLYDWGDGTYSDWVASGKASKAWDSLGEYTVKAQARCKFHTDLVSEWSDGLTVTIFPGPDWFYLIYPDEELDVPITATLTWQASEGAESYDVYLGLTRETMELIGNTTETFFTPTGLAYSTNYWWLVIAKSPYGTYEPYPTDFVTELYPANDWVKISAGEYHSVGLKADGSLWTWGNNQYGQLGEGTTGNLSMPARISAPGEMWTNIAGGDNHTLAIKEDGTLWAWGLNSDGQVGDNSTVNKLSPVQIGEDTDWSSIAGGANHTVALKTGGTLWTWGDNQYGQLGLGNNIDYLVPTRVGTATDWAAIECGNNHTIALKSDNTLWTWGRNNAGQLGDTTTANKNAPGLITGTWTAIASGGAQNIAIHTDGSLWAWGWNNHGEVGDGTTVDKTAPVQISTDTDWTLVAGGEQYSLAVKSSGLIFAWGDNSFGQFGNGTTVASNVPLAIDVLTDTWTAIAAHGYHTMALDADGALWCWGDNEYNQTGNGVPLTRNSPYAISETYDWASVSAYGYHNAALKTDGTLWCWGKNDAGQTGNGTKVNVNIPVQIALTGGTWSQVECGMNHSIAINSDGTLWAWGFNAQGRVGDGTTVDKLEPVQISSGTNWAAVGCGQAHSLAVKSDGTLWAWGYNNYYQLGLGDTTNRLTPTQVGTDTDWAAIAGGANHTIALKTNGTLWAWGRNLYGQLGLGDSNDRTTPTQVGTDTDWAEISTQGAFCLAKKSDDTLWVWGRNNYSQLGLWDAGNKYEPTPLDWGVWSVIGTGTEHSLGSVYGWDDESYGWGRNDSGQLGIGNFNNQSRPEWIQDYIFTDIDGGEVHSVGIAYGRLYAWGANTFGQLGDGNTYLVSPLQISRVNTAKPMLWPPEEPITIYEGDEDWGGLELYAWDYDQNYDEPIVFSSNNLPANARLDKGYYDTIWWFEWEPTYYQAGTYDIIFRATDIGGRYSEMTVTFNVVDVNGPPQFGYQESPVEISEGGSYFTILNADDPDADPVSYTWTTLPDGFDCYEEAGDLFISWQPDYDQAGTYEITFTASAGEPAQTDEITVTFIVANTDRPPVLEEIGYKYGFVGELLQFTLSASDPDGETISYTYSCTVPLTGITLDESSGLFSWTPDEPQANDYNFTFTVTAVSALPPYGALSDSKTILIDIFPATTPGAITLVSPSNGATEVVVLPVLTWNKAYGGLSYNVYFGPEGFPDYIGSTTGLSYTITTVLDSNTAYSWQIEALNSYGVSQSAEWIFTTMTDTPPAFTQPASDTQYLDEGSQFDMYFYAEDPEVSPVTYSFSDLPDGAEIISAQNIFSWTPTFDQAGEYVVTFTATSGPVSLSTSLAVTFIVANTDRPPVLTPPGYQYLDEGQVYSMELIAVDPDGDPITFSMEASPEITGATLDEIDGVFQWTPGYDQSGIYTVTFTAHSLLESDSEIMTIEVIDYPTPEKATIIEPADGADRVTTMLELVWLPPFDADYCDFWIGNAPESLSLIQADMPVDEFMSYYMEDLVMSTTYYWRVDTKNIAGATEGDVWSFTTIPEPYAPDAVTLPASGVVTETATLNARVNPNGAETEIYFEWGVTDTELSNTTTSVFVNGYEDFSAAAELVELVPTTTYYFRIKAINTFGEATGEILSFETVVFWKQAATGLNRSFALRSDGTLWAWGYNLLGDGTNDNRSVRSKIGTDNDWVSIAAGRRHALAIKNNGTLWTWGYNYEGQMGLGEETFCAYNPVQIGTDADWKMAACGDLHCLAIKTNGTLWAWGYNWYGQLGLGDYGSGATRYVPAQVGDLTDWSYVECGNDFSYAKKTNGSLWSWGRNELSQLGQAHSNPVYAPAEVFGSATDWQSVSAGANHTLALKADGTLWVWGANGGGQLSVGDTNTRESPQPLGSITWTAIAAGEYFSIAVKSDGTLWGCGVNARGQNGTGLTGNTLNLTQIGAANNWSSLASGAQHTIALNTNDELWTWGNNAYGELGLGTSGNKALPAQSLTATDWAKIGMGDNFSTALKADGTLWTFGSNDKGQLGTNSTPDTNIPAQVGSATWTAIAAGSYHALGIQSDGSLWAWGWGEQGQLGDGDSGYGYQLTSPVAVIGSAGPWSKVAAGGCHSAAIKTDGTLWTWGANWYGQLGNGSTTESVEPITITGTADWADVTCGLYFTLGLKTNGTIWAWGYNDSGQIGQGEGAEQQYLTPVQVGSDSDWVYIGAGNYCAFAIKDNGTLWGWGANWYGQMANGSASPYLVTTPTQIGTDANWLKVLGGWNHIMGLKTDNTLWAWGYNESGILGDGTYSNSYSPIQIGGAEWSDIEPGNYTTLAIKTDGTLWAWGYGAQGQHGDGTAWYTAPAMVITE